MPTPAKPAPLGSPRAPGEARGRTPGIRAEGAGPGPAGAALPKGRLCLSLPPKDTSTNTSAPGWLLRTQPPAGGGDGRDGTTKKGRERAAGPSPAAYGGRGREGGGPSPQPLRRSPRPVGGQPPSPRPTAMPCGAAAQSPARPSPSRSSPARPGPTALPDLCRARRARRPRSLLTKLFFPLSPCFVALGVTRAGADWLSAGREAAGSGRGRGGAVLRPASNYCTATAATRNTECYLKGQCPPRVPRPQGWPEASAAAGGRAGSVRSAATQINLFCCKISVDVPAAAPSALHVREGEGPCERGCLGGSGLSVGWVPHSPLSCAL